MAEQTPPSSFAAGYGPWALVAGASDGIGECFARGLAQRGVNVVLLARRRAVLEELAQSITREYGVQVRLVVADLTSDDIDTTVTRETSDLEVGLLVYNAGAVHATEHFLDHPVDHALELVKLNCRGTVTLVHRFASQMRERGRGGVLLLTSMAALAGSSYTVAYNATKSFDLVLAEGLWHELSPAGVDVMAVVAGATKTPSMLAANPAFEEYPNVMQAVDVAEGALDNIGKGPVWVAGEQNREAAKALLPIPRVGLINLMSQAGAHLMKRPFQEAEGLNFDEM